MTVSSNSLLIGILRASELSPAARVLALFRALGLREADSGISRSTRYRLRRDVDRLCQNGISSQIENRENSAAQHVHSANHNLSTGAKGFYFAPEAERTRFMRCGRKFSTGQKKTNFNNGKKGGIGRASALNIVRRVQSTRTLPDTPTPTREQVEALLMLHAPADVERVLTTSVSQCEQGTIRPAWLVGSFRAPGFRARQEQLQKRDAKQDPPQSKPFTREVCDMLTACGVIS